MAYRGTCQGSNSSPRLQSIHKQIVFTNYKQKDNQAHDHLIREQQLYGGVLVYHGNNTKYLR